VAPVAEEAGEADTEDRPIEPGFVLWSFRHGGVVYSCRLRVNSLDELDYGSRLLNSLLKQTNREGT
jgi:hypothetical protein